MLTVVEGDVDVRMSFKGGNDEHGYLYVGGNDRPKRRAQKAGATCEGRMYTCHHGVVCATSGRDGDTVMQEFVREMADK